MIHKLYNFILEAKEARIERRMRETIAAIRREPHIWQVGDLIDHPIEGASLLIDVDADNTQTYLVFLSCTGNQYELDEDAKPGFWYNTGLVYRYQNREQVQIDFQRGFFNTYFEE